MAPLIAIVLLAGFFAGLGLAAQIWGIDSRPTYGDDHAR
jgi:hypothetical protein